MDAVREQCRRIMLGPPPAVGLPDFCTRLGELRGRPILLVPFPAPADAPSGMWVSGQRRDYVFFDDSTSPVHQEAIIWHELSHLLLGHPGPALDPTASRQLLPDLDPAVVARMLGRGSYTARIERQAEELASLLMLDHARYAGRAAGVDSSQTLVGRLRAGLGHRDPMP